MTARNWRLPPAHSFQRSRSVAGDTILFARNAGDFAGDEFVQYEIAYYADGLARESGYQVEEAGDVNGDVRRGLRSALTFGPWFAVL